VGGTIQVGRLEFIADSARHELMPDVNHRKQARQGICRRDPAFCAAGPELSTGMQAESAGLGHLGESIIALPH